MNGPGEKLFTSSTGSFDQDGAGAFRDLWQKFEQLHHGRAVADNILKGVLCLKFILQLFDLAEILESFDSTNNTTPVIFEQSGRDTNGNPLAVMVDDVSGGVDYGFAGAHGLFQGA